MNEQLDFGIGGLFSVGFDLVGQFVGGVTIDMRVDESGQNTMFFIINTTGKHSAFYHVADMNQIYIWKEPVGSGMQDWADQEYNGGSMIWMAPGFN